MSIINLNMTEAEKRKIKMEISRLEDRQIEIYQTRKGDWAKRNYDKIKRLKRMLDNAE